MPYSIKDIFTRILPEHDSDFEIRDQQSELAASIDKTMTDGGHLAVEAGTGTGKSFSYIAPAIARATEGNQVIIVTASIALQHQLADKDIPHMQRVLKTDVPVTVLKGRSNYLCEARLKRFFQGEESVLFAKNLTDSGEDDEQNRALQDAVMQWAAVTQTGDREAMADELADADTQTRGKTGTRLHIPGSLWQHVCAHDFACGGTVCASRGMRGCFFQAARRRVFQSGIIVTNYNVLAYHFLAMLRSRTREDRDETTGEGLLPSGAIFVLDEAHRIKTIVRDSLEVSLSRSAAQNMYDLLFGRSGAIEAERAAGKVFTKSFAVAEERCKENMRNAIKTLADIDEALIPVFGGGDDTSAAAAEPTDETDTRAVEHKRYEECTNDALEDLFFALSKDMELVATQLANLSAQITEKGSLSSHCDKSTAWWMERASLCGDFSNASQSVKDGQNIVKFISYSYSKKECEYSSIPLSVRGFLAGTLFSDAHAVISLSATLTAQKQFGFWGRQVGFPTEGKTITLDSPFDYRARVQLLIPTDAPNPNSEDYVEYLGGALPPLLDVSRGRALALCTSKSMVRSLAYKLEEYADEHNPEWAVFSQGGAISAAGLFSVFKQNDNPVLVATAGFWEGFDAPGDLLRLLIITRIPFASPENLLFKEEKMYLEREGKNWFAQLALPIAEIKLRQGFGRLMRNSNDGGTVVITDNRLITKGYGKRLVKQLPDCAVVTGSAAVLPSHAQKHLSCFGWV